MKLIHVVGARPNFMKAAPLWKVLATHTSWEQILVHTGQHYDVKMSDVFFTDLELPSPDYYLGVGSGTHAKQTAAVMVAFDDIVAKVRPDLALVYGDVNSTLAAAVVCAKVSIPIGHVEAGLRSFDRTMPEEINRILTDQIADLLFTPSADGDENLLREGIAAHKIHQTGNIMIDSLVQLLPRATQSLVLEELGVEPGAYVLATIHRPSNVDQDTSLSQLVHTLEQLSNELPIIFPVHPRTRERITRLQMREGSSNLRLIEPLGYLDFLRLMSGARMVVTDSGGVQEETSYLGIPCLTLRANTERPITVTLGTNTLVGHDTALLSELFHAILRNHYHWDRRPATGIPLWDGHTAERIVAVLQSLQ